MKIENLKEGMVLKSYRELCEVLEMKVQSSDSKNAQLKELGRYCKFHKDKYKFVIDEVYDIPLPKEDNVRNTKNYPQFKVNKDKWHNKGVYMIKLDNQVYIGSTINFRDRFKQHLRGDLDYMKHTYELLNNGGKFFILHDMSDIEDIELIRMVEEEYILFYTHETDYDVINRRIGIYTFEKPKIKYKSIKIEENRLSEVLEILEERGVCYKCR